MRSPGMKKYAPIVQLHVFLLRLQAMRFFQRKIIYALILPGLLIISVTARGQQKNLKFERLDINNGLSQNNVLCTLQDSRGFMWFGTRDGLNKYDGYKFTVYKNDPKNLHSLGNNFVRAIRENKNGDLWIATSGGLCLYNRLKDDFTVYKYDPKNSSSISSDFVTSILEDVGGKIWVGTEGGLNMLDQQTNKFVHYLPKINDSTSLSDTYVRNV